MLGIKLALILLFCREGSSELEFDPEITPGYYQGDIRYRGFKQRNGVGSPIFRWPNATVPYYIQYNVFDKSQLEMIAKAMAFIMRHSCITFELATKEKHRRALKITGKKDGCNSQTVGFRKNFQNGINLQPFPAGRGCFRIGSIMHEFLHALGFEHQHVAQDRDDYVRIQWENIEKKYYTNFVNDDNTTHWQNFGEPYDYDSVMHYTSKAFSKNKKTTIVALKKGHHRMGQRMEMSKRDIRKLNKMYKCYSKSNLKSNEIKFMCT